MSETLVMAGTSGGAMDRLQSQHEEQIGETPIAEPVVRASMRLFEAQGSGVRLQGLTRTRTELNGRDSFAAQNGHALSWSDVSGESMAGVDVYKLPDASMIEGGIGGTLNIRTHLPLSEGSPRRAFTLGTQIGQDTGHLSPEFSYLHSARGTTAWGDLGVLVNLLLADRRWQTDSLTLETFERREDLRDDPVFVPRGVRWQRSEHQQQQQTLSAALQWHPSANFDLRWQSLYSQYDVYEHAVGAGLRDSETGLIPADGGEFSISDTGVFVSGDLWSQSWRGDVPGQGVRLNGTRKVADRNNRTWDNSLSFILIADAPWALRGELQQVHSRTQVLDFTVYTSTYVDGFYLDLSGRTPQFGATAPNHAADSSQYFWNAAMDHWENSKADLVAARADFAYQLPDGAGFSSWHLGVRTHQERFSSLDSGYNWGSLSDIWNMPLQYTHQNAPEYVSRVELTDFMGGKGPAVAFYLPSQELVEDFHLATEVLTGLKNGGPDEGWRPDSFAEEDQNALQRDVAAVYGMLKFHRQEARPWPFSGHMGLRAVHSQTRTLGYGEFKLLEDETQTLPPEDLAFANGARFVIHRNSRQIHWLPSAFVEFALNPNWQWQLAASRTLARPSANQLRSFAEIQAETETLSLSDGVSQTRVKRWYGRTGNPTLEPIVADQVDTALHWQISPQSRSHAALFHKQLHNSITNRVVDETFNNAEQSRNVTVERPDNVAGAYMQGAEVGLHQKLGFLPGELRNTALEAIYTRIDSRSGDTATPRLPLEGLSQNNLSLTGTYQNALFRLTFAYRWRDEYLLSAIDVDTQRPRWHKPNERLDASLAVRLGTRVQLGVEAQNLTNSVQRQTLGPYSHPDGWIDTQQHPSRWQHQGRQWRLVMRGRF